MKTLLLVLTLFPAPGYAYVTRLVFLKSGLSAAQIQGCMKIICQHARDYGDGTCHYYPEVPIADASLSEEGVTALSRVPCVRKIDES